MAATPTAPAPAGKKERRCWADESEDQFGSPDFEPILRPNLGPTDDHLKMLGWLQQQTEMSPAKLKSFAIEVWNYPWVEETYLLCDATVWIMII